MPTRQQEVSLSQPARPTLDPPIWTDCAQSVSQAHTRQAKGMSNARAARQISVRLQKELLEQPARATPGIQA